MSRLLLLAVLAVLIVTSSASARTISSCNVEPSWDGTQWELHVTGSVPNKVVPYLRIDGAQTWTSLHNQKGTIDDWTSRTDAELPAGTHLAEIIDAPNGVIGSTVVASCTFQT